MRIHLPSRLCFLAPILLLLVVAPSRATAQDCDVRYRLGSSQNWITRSLDAGESWTGTANNLNQIQNVGRNDAVVRTSGIAGIEAENRLIAAPGGSTVVLPPAVWTGLRLQRIDCQPHATVYDAGDFLEAFGSSAAALGQQALDQAREGAEGARNEALALVGSGLETLSEQAEARHAEALAGWQAFQADATSAAGQAVVALEQHFPELHLAVTASQDHAYGLPEATTALWRAQAQGSLDALAALDAELGVSATAQQILAVDLGASFPEVHALATTPCRVDPAPLDRLGQRMEQSLQELQALGSEVAAWVWPAALADPLLAQIRETTRNMAQGPCDADLSALAEASERDRAALATYLRTAQTALAGVNVRGLERGQEAFGTAVQTLTSRTGALLQLALEQERLDQAAEFRATELRQANQRLVGATGRSEGIGWLSPEYWDRRARQGDPDQLDEDVRAVETATDRYEAAIQEREANWNRLIESWEGWKTEAGALAGVVPQLRITVQGTDGLLRALSSPPALSTPAAAMGEATACLREAAARLRAEVEAVLTLSAELLTVVAGSLQPPSFPPEAAARQEALRQALLAGLAAQGGEAAALAELVASTGAVAAEIAALQLSLVDMTGGPDAYRVRAEAGLDDVQLAMDRLTAAGAAHTASMSLMSQRVDEINDAFAALAGFPEMRETLGSMDEDRAAIAAGVSSLVDCAGLRTEQVGAMLVATPQRLQNTVSELTAIALSAVQVPPEVRAAMDEAILRGNALLEAHAFLGAQALAVGSRGQEAGAAHVAAVASILPFPQPNAAAQVQATHTAYQAFWQESMVLYEARGRIQSAQAPFVASLAALTSALQNAGMDAAMNGGSIAFSALDLDLISDEAAKAQLLAERWGTAFTTFPSRLTAVGTSMLPPEVTQIASSVNAALAQMEGHLASLQPCLAQAVQARGLLQNPTHITTSGMQAVAGFQGQAQGVIADLSGLLNPTAILAGQAPTIFEAASTLQSRLGAMGSTGRNAFLDLTAPARSQAQAAATCVQSRTTSVQALANQVDSFMNPGD